MKINDFKKLMIKVEKGRELKESTLESYLTIALISALKLILSENKEDVKNEILSFSFGLLEKNNHENIKNIIIGSLNLKTRKAFKNYLKNNHKHFYILLNKLNEAEKYSCSFYIINLAYITPDIEIEYDKKDYDRRELISQLNIFSKKYKIETPKESILKKIENIIVKAGVLTVLLFALIICPPLTFYFFFSENISSRLLYVNMMEIKPELDYIDFLLRIDDSTIEDLDKITNLALYQSELFSSGKLIDIDYYYLNYKI